jgi:hypothetical protein
MYAAIIQINIIIIMENKFYKCLRCGSCCIMGCCDEGVENPVTGVCKYLVINDDLTTSCNLVMKNKHKGITIGKRMYFTKI